MSKAINVESSKLVKENITAEINSEKINKQGKDIYEVEQAPFKKENEIKIKESKNIKQNISIDSESFKFEKNNKTIETKDSLNTKQQKQIDVVNNIKLDK